MLSVELDLNADQLSALIAFRNQKCPSIANMNNVVKKIVVDHLGVA